MANNINLLTVVTTLSAADGFWLYLTFSFVLLVRILSLHLRIGYFDRRFFHIIKKKFHIKSGRTIELHKPKCANLVHSDVLYYLSLQHNGDVCIHIIYRIVDTRHSNWLIKQIVNWLFGDLHSNFVQIKLIFFFSL